MIRALPLLLLAAACNLRDPRVTAASCASTRECSEGDICFLGECRPPASNLAVVGVEVRPPNGSPFAARQQSLNLSQSVLNDVTLRIPVPISGGVSQGSGSSLPGAVVTWKDFAPAIKDRVEQITSVTGSAGTYSARLAQGTWEVSVNGPSPLPPLRVGFVEAPASGTLTMDFLLPNTASLPRVSGKLTANGSSVLAGVSVTAVDALGQPASAPALSAANGTYELVLAPNASDLFLQIGPPADSGGALAVTPLDPFPTYQSVQYAATLDLSLPDVTTLSGTVRDAGGAPVVDARVYARGSNSGWVLSRSVATDSTGAWSVALRAGTYLVEAVPSTDSLAPAVSAQVSVSLPAAAPLDLACPAKIHRLGRITGPDGNPAPANTQIIATRLGDGLVTNRTVSTTTDRMGNYDLALDGGRWRFEVVPTPDSGLPREIVQIDVGTLGAGAGLPGIQISRALQVVGTVKGLNAVADEAPIAGATVSFYASDTSPHSVFLGSALTDAQGRYKAVLPDVAQPGISP